MVMSSGRVEKSTGGPTCRPSERLRAEFRAIVPRPDTAPSRERAASRTGHEALGNTRSVPAHDRKAPSRAEWLGGSLLAERARRAAHRLEITHLHAIEWPLAPELVTA